MEKKRKNPSNRISVYLRFPEALKSILEQEGIKWETSVLEETLHAHYLTKHPYINRLLLDWFEGKMSPQEAVSKIMTILFLEFEDKREQMADYFAEWCFNALIGSDWNEKFTIGKHTPEDKKEFKKAWINIFCSYLAEIKTRENLKKNPDYAYMEAWEIPVGGMHNITNEKLYNSKAYIEEKIKNIKTQIDTGLPYELMNTLWTDWEYLKKSDSVYEIWEYILLNASKISDNTIMRQRLRRQLNAFIE